MYGRASDDPIGFYSGWKAYVAATYVLAGVAALFWGRHWLGWIATVTVPVFLFLTVFHVFASFTVFLSWLAMVAVLIFAQFACGGILEHWRTPQRALRYVVILLLVIGGEVLVIRTM
jgi:hypothetical protein